MILQNLAAKLVCLSIVVAYESSKCPFTKFSKLGHCDLIVAQYCHSRNRTFGELDPHAQGQAHRSNHLNKHLN